MAFKRIYNQFTKSLDRRFNTDLRLSPGAMSEDIQLIADIEKPLVVPFCIPKGYISLGAPIRPTAFDLSDYEAIIARYNLQEAVTQYDSVFIQVDTIFGAIVQEANSAFALTQAALNILMPGYITPAPLVPPFNDALFALPDDRDFTIQTINTTNGKGFRLKTPFQFPVKMLSTDIGRDGEPYLIWDNFAVNIALTVSLVEVYNAEIITMGSLVFQGNRTRSK